MENTEKGVEKQLYCLKYKQITEILFAGDSDFQVPNCYFLVAGHSFVCTQGWRRYLRALEGDPVPFERETNETDKFSKGRQGVSIQWRHLKIDMRWSVFYSLHYRIITTKGDGWIGGTKGGQEPPFSAFSRTIKLLEGTGENNVIFPGVIDFSFKSNQLFSTYLLPPQYLFACKTPDLHTQPWLTFQLFSIRSWKKLTSKV